MERPSKSAQKFKYQLSTCHRIVVNQKELGDLDSVLRV